LDFAMRDLPPEPRSNFRDVVGAWLVCALVAALALALSGDLHSAPMPAPVAAAPLVRPLPPAWSAAREPALPGRRTLA
jgi:hypothetical protein